MAKQTDETQALLEAIQENLSPHAVALLVAKLQVSAGTRGDDGLQAERELQWLSDQLTQLLGVDQVNALFEELHV